MEVFLVVGTKLAIPLCIIMMLISVLKGIQNG